MDTASWQIIGICQRKSDGHHNWWYAVTMSGAAKQYTLMGGYMQPEMV